MIEALSLENACGFLLDYAKKNGANAAESFGVKSTALSAECRLQKTETIEYNETQAVDLRVFIGKRQAVVSSSVLTADALKDLADHALQTAKTVPEDDFCGLADSSLLATEIKDLDLFDATQRTTQELLDLALKTEDAALSVTGISKSDGAGASMEHNDVIMLASNGFSRRFRRSSCGFSVSVIAADKDGNMETDYDYSSAVYFNDLDAPEKIGKSAADRAVKKLGATKIPSGTMDVVLEPRIARGLVGSFCSAMNGAAVARQTSFLKDMIGETVMPESLSIIDDPLKIRGAASRPCDAEGLPTVKRAVIDQGILTGWFLDLRCARKLGMKPTGHASRGLGSNPHPSASNLTLTGGKVSERELIADIKKGVYITQLFGQGVNMVTGDYSRGAVGFLIEDGELTVPVSEITIAGNLKDMFKTMRTANNVTERYAINAPTIRLSDMSVAGK